MPGALSSRFEPATARFPAAVRRYLAANPHYTNDDPGLGGGPRAWLLGRVSRDWELCRRHVPAWARSVLDIGCGAGGLDLLLYHALERPRLTLLDKRERVQRGVSHDVVGAARAFLAQNGVPRRDVRAVDAQSLRAARRLAEDRYDVIISLRALGYIFPYEAYRALVRTALAPGGVLILDVRLAPPRGPGESPRLRARFRETGFQPADSVLALLEEDVGPVGVLAVGRHWLRVKAVKPS